MQVWFGLSDNDGDDNDDGEHGLSNNNDDGVYLCRFGLVSPTSRRSWLALACSTARLTWKTNKFLGDIKI